jgi:hypothetical protein
MVGLNRRELKTQHRKPQATESSVSVATELACFMGSTGGAVASFCRDLVARFWRLRRVDRATTQNIFHIQATIQAASDSRPMRIEPGLR